MGPTLDGPLREVVGIKYPYNGVVWAIVSDQHKAIDIGRWSICGG